MIKLAYITHSDISISETFIYDTVVALNEDSNIDLTFYSGVCKNKVKTSKKFHQINTGYSQCGEKLSYLVFNVLRLINKPKAYKAKLIVQQSIAYYKLKRNIKTGTEIAIIDYATSAILVYKYLIKRNIPFIVHVHGYDITSAIADPAYKNELNRLFLFAGCFVTASDYMRRLLVLLGANLEKIEVVRHGINFEKIIPTPHFEKFKSPPSIIFLGRLTQKKHPIALLYAFRLVLKMFPNALMTIIGDGPLRSEVEDTISKLGLSSSVKLLGSLNREQSFPILASHWIYAQHSVSAINGDQEGYAISPAEAALFELPVISTIHNGIPEHVLEGITGYLVPEYNYELMADKIIHLIKNTNEIERLGKNGRKNIIKLNNPNLRTSRFKEIISKLLVTILN